MISRKAAKTQSSGNGCPVACGDVDEAEPWRCSGVRLHAGDEGVLDVAADWFADMRSHGGPWEREIREITGDCPDLTI